MTEQKVPMLSNIHLSAYAMKGSSLSTSVVRELIEKVWDEHKGSKC